jgi:hypothetical protein
MLASLRADLDAQSTAKGAVRALSRHVRARSKGRCAPPMVLVLETAFWGTECVGSSRKRSAPLTPIETDEDAVESYLRLRTIDGCDLSTIVLVESPSDIEIASTTAAAQRRLGYNTLTRAAAVLCACVVGKPIRSEISNAWSAYSLMKDYVVSVDWKDGTSTAYAEPLSAEEARARKAQCKTVRIRPIKANLRRASSIFATSPLACAVGIDA